MQKEEVFAKLTEFLTKYKKSTKLKSSDYRNFYGNVRLSLEWIKRQELNQSQITTAEEINALLNNWQNNYTSKLSISERGLEDLNKEFAELLKKAQKIGSSSSTTVDWEKGLQKAESGLKWLNWWEKNKKWVIGSGIVVGVILLSLLILWIRKLMSSLL